MEQQFEQQDTGVEEVQAAAEQSQEIEGTEGSPDAGQQSEQPEVVNNEKDFAKALSAREAQLQKKIQQEYEEKYKSYRDPATEQMMELYGYTDYDAFMQDVQKAKQDAEVQRRAQELGVDEDVIRQHLMPLNQETQQLKTELQTLREQEQARQFEARVTELQGKYPDFESNKDAIFEYAVQNRLEIEQAYKLMTYDQKLESAASNAARKTIQNLQRNADGSVGALGADAPIHDGSYLSMGPEERRKARERVKAGGSI